MRIRIPAEYGSTSSSALTLGIVWPRIAPSATSCAPGSRHTKPPVTFAIAQRDARWLSLDPSRKCPTRCSMVRCRLYEALEWAALQAGSEGHSGTYGRTLVAFSAH